MNSKHFLIRPKPFLYESLESYLWRVSFANNLTSLKWLNELGLEDVVKLRRLHNFYLEDLPSLLAILNLSNEDLNKLKVRVSNHYGEVIRYCPLCLQKAQHHKLIWNFEFLTCCPIHNVKLMNSCFVCDARIEIKDLVIGLCNKCGATLYKSPIEAVYDEMTLTVKNYLYKYLDIHNNSYISSDLNELDESDSIIAWILNISNSPLLKNLNLLDYIGLLIDRYIKKNERDPKYLSTFINNDIDKYDWPWFETINIFENFYSDFYWYIGKEYNSHKFIKELMRNYYLEKINFFNEEFLIKESYLVLVLGCSSHLVRDLINMGFIRYKSEERGVKLYSLREARLLLVDMLFPASKSYVFKSSRHTLYLRWIENYYPNYIDKILKKYFLGELTVAVRGQNGGLNSLYFDPDELKKYFPRIKTKKNSKKRIDFWS